MLIVNFIREGDVDFVPPIVSGLIATDQKDGDPAWIKGIQNPVRTPFVLRS
jgi:hypothetical protein